MYLGRGLISYNGVLLWRSITHLIHGIHAVIEKDKVLSNRVFAILDTFNTIE